MAITFRPGTPDDSHDAFKVFVASVSDLGQRTGATVITGGSDPAVLAQLWERRKPLFDHLARTADQFYVAENHGEILGYARSTLRGTVQELTEFFVLPGHQSAGLGRELLARAFAPKPGANRVIVATVDTRALSRYMKAGLTVRFPLCNLSRRPEAVTMPQTDLRITPLPVAPESLSIVGSIDDAVLGFRRDADHSWLMTERQGFLYSRDGQPAGYGYVGYRSGPFALLDTSDYPAVLAHAEAVAMLANYEYFGLEVPMINRSAIRYLLSRGYTLDSFFAFLLSDRPLGNFDHYILTSPPFFL
jgi:GNAT superfamily N-acetyltransferase